MNKVNEIIEKAKKHSGSQDLKVYENLKKELVLIPLTSNEYDYYIGLIIDILGI